MTFADAKKLLSYRVTEPLACFKLGGSFVKLSVLSIAFLVEPV